MLALGVHGMSVVTAVTAQNSTRCPGLLGAAGGGGGRAAGLGPRRHRGRRGQDRHARVARARRGHRQAACATSTAPLVVDPVCVSKHGDPLLVPEAVEAIVAELLPLATVVTPNLAEVSPADRPRRRRRRHGSDGRRWRCSSSGRVGAGQGRASRRRRGRPAHRRRRRAGAAGAAAGQPHTHGTGCTLARRSRRTWHSTTCRLPCGPRSYVTGAIAAGSRSAPGSARSITAGSSGDAAGELRDLRQRAPPD